MWVFTVSQSQTQLMVITGIFFVVDWCLWKKRLYGSTWGHRFQLKVAGSRNRGTTADAVSWESPQKHGGSTRQTDEDLASQVIGDDADDGLPLCAHNIAM